MNEVIEFPGLPQMKWNELPNCMICWRKLCNFYLNEPRYIRLLWENKHTQARLSWEAFWLENATRCQIKSTAHLNSLLSDS